MTGTKTQTLERVGPSAPEAWRNKWRTVVDVGGCPRCGVYPGGVGAEYIECCLPPFASKAEAEAEAMDDVMRQIQYHGRMTDEWLGAFKDE